MKKALFMLCLAIMLVVGFTLPAFAAKSLKIDDVDISILGEMYEEKLYINGILVYTNPSNDLLYLEAWITHQNMQLILLQTSSGGVACPATYRLVIISSDYKAYISQEFGTCSDLYELHQTPDKFSISMPDMENGKRVTYVLQKGEMVKVEK